MYKVFYCDIRNISDEKFTQEIAKLPPLRRRYILSKKDIDDRKRSLAASVLINRAILSLTGKTTAPVIAYGQFKKPYCINYNIHFNASHSGNYTAVAVSDRDIGIDIESLREYSPAIAKKYFTKAEIDYIGAAALRSERDRRFFELWTAKEAYLKLTGQGLRGGVSSFEPDLSSGAPRSNGNVVLHYENRLKDAVVAVVQKSTKDSV